ncbi:putative choline oxidase [Cavenderia fasciculata]|uniref:Choline oxidase n=1 Tax=Cavenderia fasciculata TaxID=261658 RepID=F4PIV5_CACFS|nr:putative choline oxidase [Cavenderia fasciculata]EGG24241.1 putative choline oxidase [Cavenderia fasciculata]|eukprot:XP_004362092.1 putative choline oxidase [Cavenderia fasciculata]
MKSFLIYKYILIISISFTLCIYGDSNINEYQEKKSKPSSSCIGQELVVDYLVLGAGTAGSIMASKLSEDSDTTVLLVERGEWDTDPNIYNTSQWLTWFRNPNPRFSHNYYGDAEPQLGGRKMKNPLATFVGGCSGHNAMVANSGSARFDFDLWAHFTGSENNWSGDIARENLIELNKIMQFQGMDRNRTWMPELAKAIESLGYKPNDGRFMELDATGYSTRQFWYTRGDMKRTTTYSRMLKDNGALQNRDNLDIIVNHRAVELEYEPIGRDNGHFPGHDRRFGEEEQSTTSTTPTTKDPMFRVAGVWIQNTETMRKTFIRVQRELIVSMGAIESPKFLQLNGIGDKRHLTSLGIETVVNSPWVGKHLQDHVFLKVRGKRLASHLQDTVIPLRNPIFDGYQVFGPRNASVIGNKYSVAIDVARDDKGFAILDFTLESNRPLSRGFVKITSRDPYANPQILTNFFSNPIDMEYMIDGIRECLLIQEEMAKMGLLDPSSTSDLPLNATRQQYIDFVTQKGVSDSHLTGSIRMGPDKDTASPLDGDLRVKGLKNVRVVDASVFPSIPGSPNTSVPVSLIALQAFKIIKNQNK